MHDLSTVLVNYQGIVVVIADSSMANYYPVRLVLHEAKVAVNYGINYGILNVISA